MLTTHIFLQHYWWFLISLLGALLVFLLFVQGGQTLLYTLAKNEVERSLLINSLGRKWELTFTTLVVFGGAFFASFPLFYSTSFGGAYWVWMLILFPFILQAVSYEFRNKAGNLLGERGYERFLMLNGFAGLLLLGVVVGTLFTGASFKVGLGNISDIGKPVISTWTNPAHGLEALLDIRNILLGVAVLFLARALASLYFMGNIGDEIVQQRARVQVLRNGIPFVIFFVIFIVSIFLSNGYAVEPDNGLIYMQPYKYFLNMVEMPVVGLLFLIGVLLVLYGLARPVFTPSYRKGIWFAGIGTVLTVLALLLCVGYNDTAYYPSVVDPQSSLTIYNSSSSRYTLEVMSIVSLLIPFVLVYIFYAWRTLDRKPITPAEVEGRGESY